MTPVEQLENIIRSYVQLPPPSGGGWCSVRCLVCNDHAHKRRGGWKFDGTSIGYHCFNCGAKFMFDHESSRLSDETIRILDAYGIPSDQLSTLKLGLLTHKSSSNHTTTPPTPTIAYPKPITKPEFFVPLMESSSIWRDVALEYLDERGIPHIAHDFHVVEPSNSLIHKQWLGRLIIPMYRNGELIFWQGRDMTGKKKPKYLNSNVTREAILFGYDKLATDHQSPLYVVEGTFDAIVVGGVATLTNEMTKTQVAILSRCPRPKIVIPDKTGDGDKMAKKALELGWSISIPDYGNCKDPAEAQQKYGSLYVRRAIVDGTMSATKARIAMAHLIK